jgi:hydroxymethylpyrimidine pyrophosphatase-like HAD family hydrolase
MYVSFPNGLRRAAHARQIEPRQISETASTMTPCTTFIVKESALSAQEPRWSLECASLQSASNKRAPNAMEHASDRPRHEPSSHDPSGQVGAFPGSEHRFYGAYEWCLNPFLSFKQALDCLRSEVIHLEQVEEEWQQEEVRANVFLLACAISDTVDDFVAGKQFDLSRVRKISPMLYRALVLPEKVLNARQRFDQHRLKPLRLWRTQWQDALHKLLLTCAREGSVDLAAFVRAAKNLGGHLSNEFPAGLLQMRIKSPRAFRSQDLTFEDLVTLARRFCQEHARPEQPCLVVGLRTAGSYFGPVLRAYMDNAGYAVTDFITLRPKGGVTTAELRILRACSARGGLGIVIDEPIFQGITLGICMQILNKAGFLPASISVLFPVHPAARDWRSTNATNVLKGCRVITIEPEETFRHEYLRGAKVKEAICSYFLNDESSSVTVVENSRTAQLNDQFRQALDDSWHSRLMRAYAVQVTKRSGNLEVHLVVAKSIGLGWNAYQAYFAARCLTPFIRKPLGLRYGCLFSEWVEASCLDPTKADRSGMIESIAKYVAARVNGLRFSEDPSPALCKAGLQSGMDTVVQGLSRAYNSRIVANVKRAKIRDRLSRLSTSFACLVDGNMDVSAWLDDGTNLLKTDFEDHAMGRLEASLTDPASDLATVIRSFGLSRQEEESLLGQYSALTGDTGIAGRLPFYQLSIDLRRMADVLAQLSDGKLAHRHRDMSRRHIDEWTASMVHMAEFCGTFMPPIRDDDQHRNRACVFLDVDGVIDRHSLVFPTTTRSGMRALSLLRTHGFRIFLNTARSCHDVVAYCRAYGLQGGVAESGSYVWDARTRREQVLIGSESLTEIQRAREALERLPGVFTNHFYRYSIKAFTYDEGSTRPVSAELVDKVLADVGAKTLSVLHTSTDSAITSATANKGAGLKGMLALLDENESDTIAVGDTSPDLAMFHAASRCYAPSHISVRKEAIELGCRVVKGAYQNGFLEIARHITHADGGSCPDCVEPRFECGDYCRVLMDFLGDIDSGRSRHLMRAMLDVRSIDAILR